MRSQLRVQLERAEAEVARSEKEASIEAETHEQQLMEIASAYQRLERQVVQHLKSFQRALSEGGPVNETTLLKLGDMDQDIMLVA